MSKDNISPEEKLLRLIRSPKKQAAELTADKKPAAVSNAPLKAATNTSISANIPAGGTAKPHLKILPASLLKGCLHFLNIQRVIILFSSVAFILLIISFIYPFLGLTQVKLPKISPQDFKEERLEAREEIKPYEFYAQEISGRRIFGSIAGQETEKPVNATNTDLVKDINLLGIISGDNPQAVVEDKKTQKSYYVTKGQSIGELQVEDIQENKIILNYLGQRFELSM